MSQTNLNLENESVSEGLFHDTYRMKPAEFGEILEALQVPIHDVPESRRQVRRDYWVARTVRTSRYCGRPTWFGTEAKDEPGLHFEYIYDDGAMHAAALGGYCCMRT
jgi:hypothetical protein